MKISLMTLEQALEVEADNPPDNIQIWLPDYFGLFRYPLEKATQGEFTYICEWQGRVKSFEGETIVQVVQHE